MDQSLAPHTTRKGRCSVAATVGGERRKSSFRAIGDSPQSRFSYAFRVATSEKKYSAWAGSARFGESSHQLEMSRNGWAASILATMHGDGRSGDDARKAAPPTLALAKH